MLSPLRSCQRSVCQLSTAKPCGDASLLPRRCPCLPGTRWVPCAGDTVTPAVMQGGTQGSWGEWGTQVLGEDAAVFLVIVKPLRAGLGTAITRWCLPACRHNGEG